MINHTPDTGVVASLPELRSLADLEESAGPLGVLATQYGLQEKAETGPALELGSKFDKFYDQFINGAPEHRGLTYDNLAFMAAIVQDGQRRGLLVLRESSEAIARSGLATKGQVSYARQHMENGLPSYMPPKISQAETLPVSSRYVAFVLKDDGTISEMAPITAYWSTDSNPKKARGPVELELTFKNGREFETMVLSREIPSHARLKGLDDVRLEGLQEFNSGPSLISDPVRPATI